MVHTHTHTHTPTRSAVDHRSKDMSSSSSVHDNISMHNSSSNETPNNNNIRPYISNSPPPPPTESPDSSQLESDDVFNTHNLTGNDENVMMEAAGTSSSSTPPPPPPLPPNESRDKKMPIAQDSHDPSSQEKKEQVDQNNDDDDDEWADFVDSSSAAATLNSNVFIPIQQTQPTSVSVADVHDDTSSEKKKQQEYESDEHSQPKTPSHFVTTFPTVSDSTTPFTTATTNTQHLSNNLLKRQESVPKPTNLADLFSSQTLNRIFKTVSSPDSQTIGVSPSDDMIGELNIDDDDAWKCLKEFTSVNDASTSLKFQWLFSELESSFLGSINIQRESISSNAQQVCF